MTLSGTNGINVVAAEERMTSVGTKKFLEKAAGGICSCLGLAQPCSRKAGG